ncbi:MAG: AMP-binding protein [Desulfobacteraceae bacterium]|nr:AMP-binding protein [Desulfobacteraceae bacterium]
MQKKCFFKKPEAIETAEYDFDNEYQRLKKETWLKNSFYAEFTSHQIDIVRKNIPDFLDETAAKSPEKTAIVFEGRQISYQALKDQVDRFATGLRVLGVNKGDRVGLCLPNIPQGVIAYFAIIRLGAIMIAENPLFSKEEFKVFLNQSGSKFLIVLDEIFDEKIADILDKTPLKTVITTSISDFISGSGQALDNIKERRKGQRKPKAKNIISKKIKLRDFQWILEKHHAEPLETVLDWDDPVSCFHTSGTMGRPKSVVHSNKALSSLAQQISSVFAERDMAKETFASIVPIFHSFGAQILLIAISAGAKIHLIPKASGGAILRSIEEFKPTIIPLTPPILNEILHHPALRQTDISCVKDFICGSAYLPVELFEAFKEMGIEICAGYGMLESIMSIANPRGPKGKKKPESIGIPTPNVDAVVVGKDGSICKPVPVDASGKALLPDDPNERGQYVGELCLRSPHQMLCYDQNETQTTAVIDKNGFIHSEDVAYMDAEGYFYILGRESDAFICGTSDVFPDEVEDRLIRHPAIQDACVIDIPHEIYGSAPKAYILMVQGQLTPASALQEFLKDKLATWKIPVEFEIVTSLPISSGGKKLRRVLRAEDIKKRGEQKSTAEITDKNV